MARDITDQEILQNIRAAQGELILKLLRENRSLERKARALDKILAERGMTWEQYQGAQQPPAATLLGRPLVVAEGFPDVGGIVGVAFTKELAADVAREYQTGTDAPAHGREPNVDSEETRVEAGGTGQAREPRTETEAR